MMKDVRGVTAPTEEKDNTTKIVAAFVVALGFGAIGAYSYETGTWNSAPKSIVASNPVMPAAAPDVTAPQATQDLPPLPAKNTSPQPVKSTPAETDKDPGASQKRATTETPPPMRIARAQTPAPNAAQQSVPEAAVPETVPEQPGENSAPAVSAPTEHPAPVEETPAQPAEPAPAQ